MAPPPQPDKPAEGVIDLTSSPPAAAEPGATERQPMTCDSDSAGMVEMGHEDEDDEDLKLAIALSLQQQQEDQALAMSTTAAPASPQARNDLDTTKTAPTATVNSNTSSIFNLDRKAMEAERLARLKRKRDETDNTGAMSTRARAAGFAVSTGVVRGARVSPPPLRRIAPVVTTTATMSTSVGAKPLKAASTFNNPAPTPSSTLPISSSTSSVKTYPQGKILKTHAPGYPSENTISFANLVAPAPSLQSCLLSSFIWDFDWLLPHFSTTTTNFLLVMHAKYPSQKREIEADFADIPNVRVCFPSMDGIVNCMHSKLMLLFYEERLRVVVPTANLVGFDWGVGGVMENMLWVTDLPLREAGSEDTTEFKQSMLSFLRAQGVPDSVFEKLEAYDFRSTEDVRFVHTIGGVHGGEEWRETGHCGLGKAVSSLGLATKEPIDVDFVTSSVGSLNEEFMRSVYLACQGDDGLAEYTLRNAKTFPAKRVGASGSELVQKDTGRSWRSRFRFYFPSNDTVEASNGGPGSAGTICFSQKWWDGPKFPQENMRECESVRGGLLMHNKIVFVRYPTLSRLRCAGWVYIGSANLSESAWGRLVQDKSTKKPKLNCRNWECGVVVPMHMTGGQEGPRERTPDSPNTSNLDIFASTVPIPMKWPGKSHEVSNKRPWFFGGD